MFNNESRYTLRMEITGGSTRYFVSFTDGQGIQRETEVSEPVYTEFLNFVKIERNLRRWYERHMEFSELTDGSLLRRAIHPPQSLEDAVVDKLKSEQLRAVIRSLPEKQRRRFVLHHEYGLTYGHIAKMEGCTKRAVKYSIDLAKEKILKKIKIF
jgi:RNA polymerase sigma-70 factor (ECF subfamily)